MLLCGLPGQDLPNIDFWEIDIEDKIAHLGVFGILGFLMVYGFLRKNSQKNISPGQIFLLIIVASAYGALTEILQGWLFPSRFASLSDFIADAVGAILGIVIAKMLLVKQR